MWPVWVRRGGRIGSWWRNRRERDHWGDLGVDGWIILGWICVQTHVHKHTHLLSRGATCLSVSQIQMYLLILVRTFVWPLRHSFRRNWAACKCCPSGSGTSSWRRQVSPQRKICCRPASWRVALFVSCQHYV